MCICCGCIPDRICVRAPLSALPALLPQGGFIWDWVDQGLSQPIPGGHDKRWAYGGDFGERVRALAARCNSQAPPPPLSAHFWAAVSLRRALAPLLDVPLETPSELPSLHLPS